MPCAKTPTDPQESRHMRFFCIGFRCRNDVAICINLYLRGCIVHFRKYGLPYGLSVSLCTLHLMVTHFNATLGMGGWLNLAQQGLSPCKKYKTSWRSSAKRYRIIEHQQLSPIPIFISPRISRLQLACSYEAQAPNM